MMTRLALFLLFMAPAFADEAKAPAMPPADAPHVAAFGAQDATCLEWTDICQICIRKTPTDETQCSTPGFACVAEAPVCRRR